MIIFKSGDHVVYRANVDGAAIEMVGQTGVVIDVGRYTETMDVRWDLDGNVNNFDRRNFDLIPPDTTVDSIDKADLFEWLHNQSRDGSSYISQSAANEIINHFDLKPKTVNYEVTFRAVGFRPETLEETFARLEIRLPVTFDVAIVD